MNFEIIPAIIPKNIEDAKRRLSEVRGVAPVVQIDILDGKFVPNTSYPYGDSNENHFKKTIEGVEKFPYSDEFYMEADLMIENPENSIDKFAFAGFNRIVAHIESTNNMMDIINNARNLDLEIGIAINIDTPNEVIDEYVDKIDFVQFMGIAKIGFQGESFDGRVVEKICKFKDVHSDIIISVDGGVNLKNASYLLGAGARRLVAGSAIFGSNDAARAIENFKLISLL